GPLPFSSTNNLIPLAEMLRVVGIAFPPCLPVLLDTVLFETWLGTETWFQDTGVCRARQSIDVGQGQKPPLFGVLPTVRRALSGHRRWLSYQQFPASYPRARDRLG